MVTSDIPRRTDTRGSVGVVTVTYSPGDTLHRFLASLTTATTRGVHIVVADNGSTDGAPKHAAATWPGVTLVSTAANLAYGGGANRGVAAAPAGDRLGRGRQPGAGTPPAGPGECQRGEPCPHAVSAVDDENAAASLLRCVNCAQPVGTFYPPMTFYGNKFCDSP